MSAMGAGSVLRSVALAGLANSLSLFVAAAVFDSFVIKVGWFVFAVVLVTALTVLLRGIVMSTVSRFTRAYTIIGGLILTYLALLGTEAATPDDGFSIHGYGTWIAVTLLVWSAGIAHGEVDHQAPPGVPPVRR